MYNFLLIPTILILTACNPVQPVVESSEFVSMKGNPILIVSGDTLPKVNKTKEEWKAELYFGDESSDFLVTEFRRVSSSDTPERMAAVLIEELIKGPTARGVRTIPDQTEIRSVNIDRQGQLQVDFSRDLSEFHPGGSSSEIMTVFSIVNTLTQNVEEVKSVKILIDGKAIDTIAGHIDCRQPFSSNMKIVR